MDDDVVTPLAVGCLVAAALEVTELFQFVEAGADRIDAVGADGCEVAARGAPVVRLGQDVDQKAASLSGEPMVADHLVADDGEVVPRTG